MVSNAIEKRSRCLLELFQMFLLQREIFVSFLWSLIADSSVKNKTDATFWIEFFQTAWKLEFGDHQKEEHGKCPLSQRTVELKNFKKINNKSSETLYIHLHDCILRKLQVEKFEN